MPLPRYGVAIGGFDRVYRDPPDDFGRWYHGHIDLATPSGTWTSALDVDTPTGVGISYRTSFHPTRDVLGPVAGLPSGFHLLPSTASSGAIDYIRSGFLQDRLVRPTPIRPRGLPADPRPLPDVPVPLQPGTAPLSPPEPSVPGTVYQQVLRLLQALAGRLPPRSGIRFRPWIKADGDTALKALEQELAPGRTIYIFGDRYSGPDQGVHDVHQNQGDPAGSRWWESNGIWQDGVVIVERPDGRLFVWQTRFNSQAARTDADGHPL